MKRFLYFLLTFLLLFGALTIYQYIQYQEQFDALKTARNRQGPTAIPAAIERPPLASYYTHHEQLSTIARYNPLLRATIQRKLHFYDCTEYNSALLDFYNLLNYRDRMLIQAEPTDQKRIEEEMKEYSEQLCTRWEVFAQHLQQTYPNEPAIVGLNNLCAASLIHNYKQVDVDGWLVDPIKK